MSGAFADVFNYNQRTAGNKQNNKGPQACLASIFALCLDVGDGCLYDTEKFSHISFLSEVQNYNL